MEHTAGDLVWSVQHCRVFNLIRIKICHSQPWPLVGYSYEIFVVLKILPGNHMPSSKFSFLAVSVIIGNAKQIDCMEGNFVHILQRIFGFAAELE